MYSLLHDVHHPNLLRAILDEDSDILEPKREDTVAILHEFYSRAILRLSNCPTKASLVSWSETIIGHLCHRIYRNQFHLSFLSSVFPR